MRDLGGIGDSHAYASPEPRTTYFLADLLAAFLAAFFTGLEALFAAFFTGLVGFFGFLGGFGLGAGAGVGAGVGAGAGVTPDGASSGISLTAMGEP